MSFLYIEPTMDEILKKQGILVCRDQLDIYTIVETVDHFTFGFLHVSEKAQSSSRISPIFCVVSRLAIF